MDCSTPGFSVLHQLLELTQTHVHWLSHTIQPSHPLCLLLPPSIFPSIRVFSNESVLRIRWPKYWSIGVSDSASVLPVNIQDWFPLGWTIWISLQSKDSQESSANHSSKESILQHLVFYMVWFSHPYLTTGKTIALTIRTCVGKVMSLLSNMLSRLVIGFLPRSKCVLISWLQSPSVVILEPPKIKSVTVSTVSPAISHEVMGPDAMISVFWTLSFKPTFLVVF